MFVADMSSYLETQGEKGGEVRPHPLVTHCNATFPLLAQEGGCWELS